MNAMNLGQGSRLDETMNAMSLGQGSYLDGIMNAMNLGQGSHLDAEAASDEYYWVITSDSEYVVKGITEWLPNWKVSLTNCRKTSSTELLS